ncbi:MAG: hypothetical protein VW710_04800, partial [Flavobacteriaceae bacterium]
MVIIFKKNAKKLLTIICFVFILFSLPLLGQIEGSVTRPELVDLFKAWRRFEVPPLLNGVPDYSQAAFISRAPRYGALRTQLEQMPKTNWAVNEQVDWHLIWAEMNGYLFHSKILKPWERDPAFYKIVWSSKSDVPAHEGPTHHAVIELWQYEFPLDRASQKQLSASLALIPEIYKQAKINLIGNAKELWIAGIRDIQNQASRLEELIEKSNRSENKELVIAIEQAKQATQEFVSWLEKEAPKKDGPSGIGKEHYTWYQQNVHLVPLTWEEEVQLLQRELARAWSSLKLEEHRNRNLPALLPAENQAAYQELAKNAATELLEFLDFNQIVTVKPYFEKALKPHWGKFIPKEKRNFFWITAHLDPKPLFSHLYHWFELERMIEEPHPNPLRAGALLYNIFDSRSEGLATAAEEIFMHAGLYDKNPRAREIVYILIAQRAARGLGSLYAHANLMTMEEAGTIHSEYTPRGWMKTEKELLLFEQHLYLRQPGYGTSYITGKYLIESL